MRKWGNAENVDKIRILSEEGLFLRIFEGFFHIIHIIHNQNSGKIGLKVSAANHN